MEGAQSALAIAAAVVFGGAMAMIGGKFFPGKKEESNKEDAKMIKEEKEQPQQITTTKSKKKKSKTSKAVPTVEAKKPVAKAAEPKPSPPATTPAQTEKPPAKPEAANKAAPAAAAAASKKKKKSNNKKKPAAKPAPQPTVSNAAKEEAAQAAEAEAVANAAAIVEAAEEAARAAAEDEEGWTTVPSRSKKKPMVAPSNEGVEVALGNDGNANVSLQVGDFAATIIGPGGSKITEIQQQSGAKVDVDKSSKTCTISGTVDQVNIAKAIIVEIIGSQKKDTMELGRKRGLVFGPGGETIRKIQSESGARIELDRNSTECVISGKDTDVAKAKQAIQAILDSTNVGSVILADKDRAAIIGKGGENIKRLQAESGATIDIDNETSICVITGEADQVRKAEELVKLYIEHRGPPPECVETMVISIDSGRLLIGKQGATVQQMQTSTNTRINVKHGIVDSTIVISGDTADVARCVANINKMIDDHSHQTTVTLSQPKLRQAIIGKEGSTINKIREETDARIEVTSELVTIYGTKEQISKAKAKVEKIVAAELGPPPVPSGQTQQQLDLGSATGKIIGTAGTNIARLEKEHECSIVIKNGTMCYITGPSDAVENVRSEVDQVLERHEAMLEKARKQEEELAKVTAANGTAEKSVDPQGEYSGWDVPALEGNWGSGLVPPTGEWGQAAPTTNGNGGSW